MGVSKVDYGDRTLIDLTQDTVTADKLMQGYTAHGANGERIVGTATGGSGDMLQADYDSDSTVKNAGGIADYVEGKLDTIPAEGSTIDLNDLMDTGDYCITSTQTKRNAPPTSNNLNCLVRVTRFTFAGGDRGTTMQEYFEMNGGVPTVWIRRFFNNTWSEWSIFNNDARSHTNPNLIDNPWFTVNQRRRNSLPSVSYAYWMDRWKTKDLTYSDIHCGLDSYGLKIPSYSGYGQTLIKQYIGPEKINKFNRRYTLSVMYSDGSIESETGIIPTPTSTSSAVISFESQKGISLELANIGTTGNYEVRIVVESGIPSEIIIRAVKLELGDVSTLAQDVMPDYATELLKCQMSTIDSQDIYANRNVINAELQLFKDVTLSTTSEVNCTFSSEYIHSNSDIDVLTNVYGILPCKVEAYSGICVVTFPKQSEAQYIGCKICVKNNMV